MSASGPIFRLFRSAEWRSFAQSGSFEGSADDRRDGFIHMSTAEQAEGTRAKHYASVGDLVVAAFDASVLSDMIRWEPSREGSLFPHIYGALSKAAFIGASVVGLDGLEPAMARALTGERPA
jgi:uncharacterized protein (DUF952 family)